VPDGQLEDPPILAESDILAGSFTQRRSGLPRRRPGEVGWTNVGLGDRHSFTVGVCRGQTVEKPLNFHSSLPARLGGRTATVTTVHEFGEIGTRAL